MFGINLPILMMTDSRALLDIMTHAQLQLGMETYGFDIAAAGGAHNEKNVQHWTFTL
jgi:hypothetical protein